MLLRRVLFFFINLLTATVSPGQPRTDSLKALLNAPLEDTAKVDVLLALSAQESHDSLSSRYLNEAIAISERINDPLRIGNCYYRLAFLHDSHGNIAEARAALDVVSKQLQHFRHPLLEAKTINYYGILDYFEGNYDDAVTALWKAVRLYDALGNSLSAASCYLNIGNCYKALHNNSKALNYFSRGLKVYQSLNNESGIAMALGNIGNIYLANRQYDSALYCFQESLQVNLNNNFRDDARIDLNNIGNLYLEKGEHTQALPYFKRSYAIAESIGSQPGMLTAGYNIGVVEMKSNRIRVAIDTFQSQLKTAKRFNYKDHIKDLYAILSYAHEELREYPTALAFRKEYEVWKDSLINEHHLNEVKEQEIKYETEKKDNQIQLLAKEKELQEVETARIAIMKNTFVIGFVLVTIIGALAIYVIRQRLLLVTKDKAVQESNLRQQMSELEMKALRAQINPHFLFNCLNSINRMIVKGENENASSYLKKFAKLVRLIVENFETNQITLENELSLIESYIQLEGLRFKRNIVYEIHADEQIEKENTHLPPMVLQPFVENAIWHGLMHKDGTQQGLIKISVKKRDETLLCVVEDNGVGREKSMGLKEGSDGKTKSMGMKVTEQRLQLLSGVRTSELIQITDLKDTLGTAIGTRVEITIPL